MIVARGVGVGVDRETGESWVVGKGQVVVAAGFGEVELGAGWRPGWSSSSNSMKEEICEKRLGSPGEHQDGLLILQQEVYPRSNVLHKRPRFILFVILNKPFVDILPSRRSSLPYRMAADDYEVVRSHGDVGIMRSEYGSEQKCSALVEARTLSRGESGRPIM